MSTQYPDPPTNVHWDEATDDPKQARSEQSSNITKTAELIAALGEVGKTNVGNGILIVTQPGVLNDLLSLNISSEVFGFDAAGRLVLQPFVVLNGDGTDGNPEGEFNVRRDPNVAPGTGAIGRFKHRFANADSDDLIGAEWSARALDITVGQEEIVHVWTNRVAGALAERMRLAAGLGVGTTNDPGAGKIDAVNGYEKNGIALPIQEVFDSGEIDVTAQAQYTLPHGLSRAPILMQAWLVCKTADAGLTPGERTPINPGINNDPTNGSRGINLRADATDVRVRVAQATTPITIINPSTTTAQSITAANWKLQVYAFA